jgi:hypothetical protein
LARHKAGCGGLARQEEVRVRRIGASQGWVRRIGASGGGGGAEGWRVIRLGAEDWRVRRRWGCGGLTRHKGG